MRTVIVYESMYGNTHAVAEHVAAAARRSGDVQLVAVCDAKPELVDGADLVIVGGPTHLHGMSWSTTRHTAIDDADKRDSLDPDAAGPGLRDWFHHLGHVHGIPAAAFDTRFDANPTFTGRASQGISRRLRHHGFTEAAEPASFLIDKDNHLIAGEADRAQQWAESIFAQLQPGTDAHTRSSP